jgi:F420-non-reducing hydrogenase iron-sulfur subunit
MSTAALVQLGTPTQPAFKPRIVGFLCNWCSYAGADKAGASQLHYPPGIHFVRVMCTGRIDPQFVMKAFQGGADGVVVLGCHPGDCHYHEQNYRMVQRHRLVLQLLGEFGIQPERCRLDWVSAAEGERFAQVVKDTVEAIGALGPLGLRDTLPQDDPLLLEEPHSLQAATGQ